MYQIILSITPEGMTQCDLDTSREEVKEAEAFFTFLRPHLKALHWLATEFQSNTNPPKDQTDHEGGDYA